MSENREKFNALEVEDLRKADNDVLQPEKTNIGESPEAVLQRRKRQKKSHENKESVVVEKIMEALASDNTSRAIKLLRKSKTKEAIIANPEIQQSASEALGRKIACLGNTGSAIHIAKSFNLPDKMKFRGVEQGLSKTALYLFLNKATDIGELFNLPESSIKRAAYHQAVNGIGNGYTYGAPRVNDDFRTKFKLSEEEFKKAAEEGMLKLLSFGNIRDMIRIKDKFKVSDETLEDPKFKKAAKEGMILNLSKGEIDDTATIKDEFKLPDEISDDPELKKAAKEGMLQLISWGKINEMKIIKNWFKINDQDLDEPEFKKAAEKGAGWKLSQCEMDYVETIKGEFDLFYKENSDTIDMHGAKNLNSSTLINFVPHLGHIIMNELYPKTFEKAVTLLSKEIGNNEDLADYFLEKLPDYYSKEWVGKIIKEAIKHYSVANKFINEAKDNQVAWSQEDWVLQTLAQAKVTVEKHRHGEEGFLEGDEYDNHPLRSIRSSVRLGSIMAEKIEPEKSEVNLTPEALEALQEINKIIENKHRDFLESLERSSAVPEEDKIALTDPEQSKVKMNNLLPNVRNFISRFLTQMSYDDDMKQLSSIIVSGKDYIEHIVEKGFRLYLNVYEIDIPLYDKLYEEFDNWREAGRYPMEVYLGRDGVYAWIGRRAQDATRRSKVGREKLKELHSEGEVIEINPKYIVYPRHFRDNINYQTKRKFLEQEQISPDMDPLFYDTGYTGTIPEQIMRIMEFDQSEIEERIRLLSAPSAKRRVRGVPENARNEIIEYIEHNAKTEESAVGLVQDKKTGEIRHVASPTSPEEQFYFMMIKQAIARHYMVQERLHFREPENTNYDSENYYIRVRQEYADMLPKGFLENPKQFFEQQSTPLKGGKDEGKYPEEEVLTFKLEDGTKVIAKKIEIRKTKEARKEFMILIASKKIGLPTAEPIGYLSGKEKEDGSYLLMKKIEGYSGRKFEKYLKESGKYTNEQIASVMKAVADRLNDLAQIFRNQLNIDKRWRIKDTIIQFDEESGEVTDVIPIDWERVKIYDPNNPQKIDLIE